MTSLWSVTYRAMPGTSPKRRGPATLCRATGGHCRVGQGTERREGKRGKSPNCVPCGEQLGAGMVLSLGSGTWPWAGLGQGRFLALCVEVR